MFIKNANKNANSIIEIGSGYNDYEVFNKKYKNTLNYQEYLKLKTSKGLNKLKMVFLFIIRLVTSRTALNSSKKALKWILKLSGFIFIGNSIVNLYKPVEKVYSFEGSLLSFFVKNDFSKASFLSGKEIAEIKKINFMIHKVDTFIHQNTFIFLIATIVIFYFGLKLMRFKTKKGESKISKYIFIMGIITFLIPTFNYLKFYIYQNELITFIEIFKDIIPFI